MAAGTTVLERVRALESKLPGLKEKLGPYTHPGDDARISTAASGEGASLMARVDALEDAVRVLMTAQVGPFFPLSFLLLSNSRPRWGPFIHFRFFSCPVVGSFPP